MDAGEKLRRAVAAFDTASYILSRGGYKESKSPRAYEYLVTHPACGSGRLRFNTQKQTGICWGCHKGCDTLELIEMLERTTMEGAIDFVLARYVGGDANIERLAPVAVIPDRAALRRLPPLQWPHGVELLTNPHAPPHADAWRYAFGRGLTVEQVIAFRLGVGRSGRYTNRLIFPVYMDHALVYFQARAMWDPPAHLTGAAMREWKETTGYRKSLNPLSTGAGEATASEIIFNYDRASSEPHVVICEGPIDAIKVGPHAVALMGKADTPEKLERLRRMRAHRFTVYLDRGREERIVSQRLAGELAPYAPTFICEPPPGHDAGSLTPEQNAWLVAQAQPYRPGGTLEGIGKT